MFLSKWELLVKETERAWGDSKPGGEDGLRWIEYRGKWSQTVKEIVGELIRCV